MKVIIAGSRVLPFCPYKTDLQLLREPVLLFECRFSCRISRVVSGCARGADKLGEKFAAMRGIGVDRYFADWDTHGKAAGYIRNKRMVDSAAEGLIALWDTTSKGTKHLAIAKKLKIIVWNPLTNTEVVIY